VWSCDTATFAVRVLCACKRMGILWNMGELLVKTKGKSSSMLTWRSPVGPMCRISIWGFGVQTDARGPVEVTRIFLAGGIGQSSLVPGWRSQISVYGADSSFTPHNAARSEGRERIDFPWGCHAHGKPSFRERLTRHHPGVEHVRGLRRPHHTLTRTGRRSGPRNRTSTLALVRPAL
jgi:hypothetical protein